MTSKKTPMPAKWRNQNLAKIHIAKAALGMDDDSYRAMLCRVAGVRSAKDLAPRQVDLVLVELERLGWQPPQKPAGRAAPKVAQNRETVKSKIAALLTQAQRPWEYADGVALRMFKVQRLEWLDDQQLYKVMQALAMDAARKQRGK